MMAGSGNHALIFGASGVSGWAIARECLNYPTPSAFARVTALANRPISIEESSLPRDERLKLAHGINLMLPEPGVSDLLRAKVPDIDTVTHVFFAAYIEEPDYPSLVKTNTSLLHTAIAAVSSLSPALKSVILQTGGKRYGVEFADKIDINPPLKETSPRIAKPYAQNIFYYSQVDTLTELSRAASWTFTEVVPDVIVGFTPGSNFMNSAQGIGLFLSLQRAVHGENAEVSFPGSEGAWTCKHTDTSQDILAKQEIFCALHPEQCGWGKAFNAADGNVTRWCEKWPKLCAYFGLRGVPPDEETKKLGTAKQFVNAHQKTWQELVKEHGLKEGIMEKYSWGFMDGTMGHFDFDRQFDLSAIRAVGFEEEVDSSDGYRVAFDRMRAARIIP